MSDLIEKLGGYSAAKAEANAPVKLKNFFDYEQLDKDLLEYRRQHNIYEVGDNVVYLSNIAPEHDDIYELSKIGKMYHVLKIGRMDYNAKFNHIRHATDAEIKAGKRLEGSNDSTSSDHT